MIEVNHNVKNLFYQMIQTLCYLVIVPAEWKQD